MKTANSPEVYSSNTTEKMQTETGEVVGDAATGAEVVGVFVASSATITGF
jgi:hypothetical protein